MSNIQDIRNSANPPQLAYAWEVEIVAPSIVGAPPILAARAETLTLPEKSIESYEINHKSRKSRFAGRDASPGTFTVQFWDDESHQVYDFFDKWIENGISNSQFGGGLSRAFYEAELRAKMQAHDEISGTGIHKFTKVWPSSLGDISLSYDASDKVIFTVTFTYDEHLKETNGVLNIIRGVAAAATGSVGAAIGVANNVFGN